MPDCENCAGCDYHGCEKDDLFEDAAKLVFGYARATPHLLQRQLNIGYARACRIIEQLAAVGILGNPDNLLSREVIMTADEYATESKKRRTF